MKQTGILCLLSIIRSPYVYIVYILSIVVLLSHNYSTAYIRLKDMNAYKKNILRYNVLVYKLKA